MKIFDSHAHYNDEKFDLDRETLLENIYAGNVKRIINAGYDVLSSQLAVKMAELYPEMYVIAGISPNNLPEVKYGIKMDTISQIYKKIEQIREIAKHKKVVGIGEIGLDYYWTKDNKEAQKLAFIEQIKLANELKLPISIHCRDAYLDTIAILDEHPVEKKGVFHCVQLNRELVREALDIGFYVSFAGYVTFKNAVNADPIIEMVPLDRMLVETDSPYMAPEPNRGTRNDSRNLEYIIRKIANVKNVTEEEVAEQTFKNASKLFGIRAKGAKKEDTDAVKVAKIEKTKKDEKVKATKKTTTKKETKKKESVKKEEKKKTNSKTKSAKPVTKAKTATKKDEKSTTKTRKTKKDA